MTVRTEIILCLAVTGGSRKPLIYIMSVGNVLTQLVGRVERNLNRMLNLTYRVEDGELVVVLISRHRYGRG